MAVKEINRPIVFICHSLGGIVAKKVWSPRQLMRALFGTNFRNGIQALLLFCLEEQTKVQKAVYGIIFLGETNREGIWLTAFIANSGIATPHNGSSIAACGKVIANIVTACTPMHPPGKLLSALGPK